MVMERTPKILVVDDDATARNVTAALLASCSYELAFATNGIEALERLEEAAPDLILLDVMMPEMDGFTTCERIKSDPRWAHIPIILLTALDIRENLVRGLDAGADEFLTKPMRGAELRARVRSMLRIKQQYDELEAALKLRDSLAHLIVHDMRNPLTSILGFSQLLQKGNLRPEQESYLGVILSESQRLGNMIDDLLVLTRLEHGQLRLNRRPIVWESLTEWLQRSFEPLAQINDSRLLIVAPKGPAPEVLLDEDLFRRVLDNLVSNALRSSPPGRDVVLEYEFAPPEERDGNWSVRLRVKDEGESIPDGLEQRIFEKFGSVEMKTNGINRKSLNLHFCRLVVEAHGGRIYTATNQPRGVAFTIEI